MKTVEILIEEIKGSSALQQLLSDAFKNNTLTAFLTGQSCEATAEDFITALKAPAVREMDDTTLDAVAGGINVNETVLSILTLGVGCATVAIISAARSGVGDGPNDQILCNDENSMQMY